MGYDEADTCWHLMTVTEGGTVSILRNLDAPTARQAYQRLRPDSRPTRGINMPDLPKNYGIWSYGLSEASDGRVKTVEILGPEGAELQPWRGVPPLLQDMTATWATGHARYTGSEEDVMSMEDARELRKQRERQWARA